MSFPVNALEGARKDQRMKKNSTGIVGANNGPIPAKTKQGKQPKEKRTIGVDLATRAAVIAFSSEE